MKEPEVLRRSVKENVPIPEKVLQLQRNYASISPETLENILETLSDWNCLNDRGKTLRSKFWEVFIRE